MYITTVTYTCCLKEIKYYDKVIDKKGDWYNDILWKYTMYVFPNYPKSLQEIREKLEWVVQKYVIIVYIFSTVVYVPHVTVTFVGKGHIYQLFCEVKWKLHEHIMQNKMQINKTPISMEDSM